MSVRAMTEVFRRSQTTLGTRLVLLAIADAAGDDGIAWPGNENLAEKAMMADSSVRRCVKDAADQGELQVWRVRVGRSTINVYRVVLGDLDEPNLRRMPKEIAELFKSPPTYGSPADPERVNDSSHPPNTSSSPADPEQDAAGGVNRGKEEPLGTENPLPPPAIVLADGRNLPLDALLESTGVDPASPRAIQAVVALNGRLHKTTGKLLDAGIRHLFWIECVRWAEEHGQPERIEQAIENPDEWSKALARRIHEKAERYAQTYRGAAISPKALRDHWLDLERSGTGRGLSPDEIERFVA